MRAVARREEREGGGLRDEARVCSQVRVGRGVWVWEREVCSCWAMERGVWGWDMVVFL